MQITARETATQVLVYASTTMTLEDFTVLVGNRSARIKRVNVSWFFTEGAWTITGVHLWGPVIRKSDGAESTQHVSEHTMPAGTDGAQYGVLTPPELVDLALANAPTWTPTINASPYPRYAALRASF